MVRDLGEMEVMSPLDLEEFLSQSLLRITFSFFDLRPSLIGKAWCCCCWWCCVDVSVLLGFFGETSVSASVNGRFRDVDPTGFRVVFGTWLLDVKLDAEKAESSGKLSAEAAKELILEIIITALLRCSSTDSLWKKSLLD